MSPNVSPKHKNAIFVLFFSFVPPFSGFSSTKLRFLCLFRVRPTRFRPFRAQNRHFCALLGSGTPIFRPFKHKISIFVLFWGLEPHFPAFQAQNQHFCALEAGDWHQGKRKLASGSITMGFLQITAHVSKTQMSHNQIINF